jgi:hypothetical protein
MTRKFLVPLSGNLQGNADTATKLVTERAIALDGDVVGSTNFDGSASASIFSTLSNTEVNPGSYGSSSQVATFTVDSKGRITSAGNASITINQSSVINLTTDLSAKANLASPTFTGTVTVPTPTVSGAAATKGYVDFVVSQVEGGGGGGGATDWNLYWQASW